MLGRTHIVFGLLIGILLLKYSFLSALSLIKKIIFLALIMFFSLIPDVDEKKSKIGRKVKLIGFFFRHRGFFHSLIFILIIGYILFYLFNLDYYVLIACTAGFFSHLVLDMLTISGIRLYPFKARTRGFIKTGSLLENILLAVMAVFILLLIL